MICYGMKSPFWTAVPACRLSTYLSFRFFTFEPHYRATQVALTMTVDYMQQIADFGDARSIVRKLLHFLDQR